MVYVYFPDLPGRSERLGGLPIPAELGPLVHRFRSQESVGADVVETALQLAFLLVFALVAAGYVMKSLSCEL